jgi:hypothetical protein
VVNSFHHQSIDKVAPGFRVSARSPDRVVEAIERTDHPFYVGVQWHPERMPDSPTTRHLLGAFLDAARGVPNQSVGGGLPSDMRLKVVKLAAILRASFCSLLASRIFLRHTAPSRSGSSLVAQLATVREARSKRPDAVANPSASLPTISDQSVAGNEVVDALRRAAIRESFRKLL